MTASAKAKKFSALFVISVLTSLIFTGHLKAKDLLTETSPFFKGITEKYKIEYGGHAEAEFAVDTKRDNSEEDLYDGRNKIFLYLSAKPINNLKLFLSGKVYLNYSFGATPQDDSPLSGAMLKNDLPRLLRTDAADRGPDDIYQLPYEAYVTYSHSYFDIKAGQQIIKWGTNDFLSPSNLINPVDLRGFIDPEREDVVIPVLALKGDIYPIDSLKIEGIFVPYFVKSEFHLFQTDFAICQREICPIEEDEDIREKMPDRTLESSEYGAMIHFSMGDFDAEVSYFNTREDFPVFLTNFDIMDPFIRSFYPELEIYGGGMSYLFKDLTFKVEGAYSPERHVTRNDKSKAFTTVKGTTPGLLEAFSPWQAFAAEVDYQRGVKYFVSVGYERQEFTEAPPDMVVYSEDISLILVLGQALYMREQLALKLGLLYFIEDEDYMVSPRITYSFTDHLSATIGANTFEGTLSDTNITQVSPLGIYADNDQVFIGVRYYF